MSTGTHSVRIRARDNFMLQVGLAEGVTRHRTEALESDCAAPIDLPRTCPGPEP